MCRATSDRLLTLFLKTSTLLAGPLRASAAAWSAASNPRICSQVVVLSYVDFSRFNSTSCFGGAPPSSPPGRLPRVTLRALVGFQLNGHICVFFGRATAHCFYRFSARFAQRRASCGRGGVTRQLQAGF